MILNYYFYFIYTIYKPKSKVLKGNRISLSAKYISSPIQNSKNLNTLENEISLLKDMVFNDKLIKSAKKTKTVQTCSYITELEADQKRQIECSQMATEDYRSHIVAIIDYSNRVLAKQSRGLHILNQNDKIK